MRIFEKYFSPKTPLETIDRYVRLVLMTFDGDDEIGVYFEDHGELNLVRIEVYNRTLN